MSAPGTPQFGLSARTRAWGDVLRGIGNPKVLTMLLLGFAAGVPFMLVGNTMGMWLREGGAELATIGYLSWVGIMYSSKFLWAPVIEKTHAPFFGRRLGHRRGWMLLAQIVVFAALCGMAKVTPGGGLLLFSACALLAAFASASQDIVIDAWRIETADSGELLSMLSSAYQVGYRTALLLTEAWILVLAAKVGWPVSYVIAGSLMLIGMGAVLFASETRRDPAPPVFEGDEDVAHRASDAMVVRWLVALVLGVVGVAFLFVAHNVWDSGWTWGDLAFAIGVPVAIRLLIRPPAGPISPATWSRPFVRPLLRIFDAIVMPIVEFFREHGSAALWILLAISLYRLPDFVMGPMANPFYHDLGIAKETVGAVRGSYGWAATTVGIALAGISALRFGLVRTLLIGAVIGPASILAFSYLAYHGQEPSAFIAAMIIDNVAQGFAGVALVAYMSSLTRLGFTATQYALLSSFYALPGKILKGFSGAIVDHLSQSHALFDAYAIFFAGAAGVGLPALVLCVWLARRSARMMASSTPEAA